MRAPLSISLRLGLLFAAIAAAVFVAVGAYLYQTLSSQMGRRDDLDLLNKAVLVRQLLQGVAPGESVPRPLQEVLGRVIAQDGMMLRVAAPDGRVLADSIGRPLAPQRWQPARVPPGREPQLADIAGRDGPGGPTRVLSFAAPGAGQVLDVTLVRMRSDRLAILKRYLADLAGALLAGTLLATALGFAAVRRGLRPLRGVAAKANEISAQRLQTRLDIGTVPAELCEFCLAFNAMLGRLEEGVQRLSGFAADLAHDLRTPVNALMMQTQVALSRQRPAEEYQVLLASNVEEYERLARMIENTLFLARADNAQLAVKRDRLDIGAELARIQDYFEMLAEDQGVLLSIDGPAAGALEADPVLLRRALSNLVANAIAHTPRGGTVRMMVGEEEGWLALSVANTGAGIPEEHLARVFERYYRADPARGAGSSAGLGLAIVQAIMRLHGGSARVENAPGGGAVFSLRFPKAAKGQPTT